MNNVSLPFQHPFMLTLCGPSQSGKTYWILQLLKNINTMITPTIVKIVYLYSIYQPLYGEMEKVLAEKTDIVVEFIDCQKGIPRITDIQTNTLENTLIILDDLMLVATSSKENLERIDNIATQDVHHRNISVIFTCQNLTYGNGKLRNLRVNSQYYVMFKNLSDHNNMYTICDNKKIDRNRFNKVLSEINEKPYGHLVFDNCRKGFANCRIRTDVFPHEPTMIYDL